MAYGLAVEEVGESGFDLGVDVVELVLGGGNLWDL